MKTEIKAILKCGVFNNVGAMGMIRILVLNNVTMIFNITKAVGMHKCGVFEQISSNWIYVGPVSLSLIEDGGDNGFCDDKRDA